MNYFVKLKYIKIVILTLFLFSCKSTKIENYKGKNINEVKPLLEQQGLQVKVTSKEIDQEKNIILEQNLAGNTQLQEGKTIHFVVSKLPVIKLSNYKNKNINEIRPLLEKKGIVIKTIDREVDLPSGTILSDTPLSAEKYSTLTFEVSKQSTVQVPEVKNMTVSDASKKLKQLGFPTKVVQDISAIQINPQLPENTLLVDDVLNLYLTMREKKPVLDWLKECLDDQSVIKSNINCTAVQQDVLQIVKQNQQRFQSAIRKLEKKLAFNQKLLKSDNFVYKHDQKVEKNAIVNIHIKKLPTNEQEYIQNTIKIINLLVKNLDETLNKFNLLENLLISNKDIFKQENQQRVTQKKVEPILNDAYDNLYQLSKQDLENLKKESQQYAQSKSSDEENKEALKKQEALRKQVTRQKILGVLYKIDEDIEGVSFNYNKSRFDYRDSEYNSLVTIREKNKLHGKILMSLLGISESKPQTNSQKIPQPPNISSTSGNVKLNNNIKEILQSYCSKNLGGTQKEFCNKYKN